MKTNQEILAARIATFALCPGARVGDFLRLPRVDDRAPEFTRFTHRWDAFIQTGGIANGSYYLGDGHLSYSGGLDPGVQLADVIPTQDTREGSVWFFDGNMAGAGRGVSFTAPFRVFALRPGADTSGLWEMQSGYHLGYHAAPVGCSYHWTVTRRGESHTAFRELPELLAWLERERLAIASDPHQSQRILWPAQATA